MAMQRPGRGSTRLGQPAVKAPAKAGPAGRPATGPVQKQPALQVAPGREQLGRPGSPGPSRPPRRHSVPPPRAPSPPGRRGRRRARRPAFAPSHPHAGSGSRVLPAIEALPHPTWAKRECLIARGHRVVYDRAYRAAGMTIIEAPDKRRLIELISERTAMIASGLSKRAKRPKLYLHQNDQAASHRVRNPWPPPSDQVRKPRILRALSTAPVRREKGEASVTSEQQITPEIPRSRAHFS